MSESQIFNTHIDKLRPNWMKTFLRMQMVEDETSLFNYGQEKELDFYSFNKERLELSYNDEFPSAYKIAGLTIFRDFDLRITSRATYDMF